MSEDQAAPEHQDPREQGAAFLASYDALVARNKLLETENKAVHDQYNTVMEQNDRLQARVEQLVGRLDTVLHEANADKQLLNDLASRLLAGLNSRRSVRELRGSPQRDDPMPRIVQMGPRTA